MLTLIISICNSLNKVVKSQKVGGKGMKKSILLVLAFFSGAVASSSGGVQPLDQAIPSFDVLDQVITGPLGSNGLRTGGWIENNFTSFVNPADPNARISDVGLRLWRSYGMSLNINNLPNQATVSAPGNSFAKFSQPDLDSIKALSTKFGNTGQPPVTDILRMGHYEPNWDALVASIQKGDFANLTYNRLVLSEYLLGRVASAVSPLVSAPWLSNTYSGLPSDQDILKSFMEKNGTYLMQTRYARNAFAPYQVSNNQTSAPTAPSGWGAIGAAPSAASTPDYTRYLKPVDTFAGLILVNRTSGSNAFTIGAQTNQVQPGTVGFYPALGSADKWDSAPVDGQLWGKKRSVAFSVQGMSGQGQVQLYENQNQLPQISIQGPSGAAIPVNFDNALLQGFFKDSHPWTIVVKSTPENALQVIGLAKLNTVSFPNALNFVGAATSNSAAATSFSLGDLWNMPMNLYKQTIASVNESAGQPYPLASWVLQAIFNGYLQTSFYKPVVQASVGTIQWKDAWATPSADDWVNPGFGLDWKLLRALVVTQAANRLMYINNVSLASIEQILAAPAASIQNIFYVGATDQYVPVVPVKS